MKNRRPALVFLRIAACFACLQIQAGAFELYRTSGFQPPNASCRTPNDRLHLNAHSPTPFVIKKSHNKKPANDEIFPSRHGTLRGHHAAPIRSGLAALMVAWSVVASCSVPAAMATTTPTVTTTMVVASASGTPTAASIESSTTPGNLVLGGWIGISAYAGIKGVWDKIKEGQESDP